MLEIKITIDDALQLLLERMKFELRMRQKAGKIPAILRIENLTYKELMPIIDSAIFDTVFSLPADILASETNLTRIITSTVHALAKILNKEEFVLFSEKNAHRLIQPIVLEIQAQSKESNFLQN
jgi:hypothetical protein